MCLFFIINLVIQVKIYIDLILFLNFGIDLILLLGVGIILKRKSSINRLIFSSFIGSLSVLFLFVKISTTMLFLYKIVMCFMMVIISFRFINIRYTLKNFIFTYILSFFLGGILYYLNVSFSYKNIGIIFYHDGISINYIFIIIMIPISIYFYIKEMKSIKSNYNFYYDVLLNMNNNSYKYIGYLDTGNKVIDPFMHLPVIFIDKRKLLFDINEFKMVLVPIKTASGDKLISCFRPDNVIINNKTYNKVLVGIMDDVVSIDGVDIILNSKIMEDL